MGTFNETAVVDYRSLFANQEKQTSRFPFLRAADKRKLPFLLVSFSVYTVYMYIFFKWKMENRSLVDFPESVYCLLIVQTEVCYFSVCWQRNKGKLSVCKWTKWTKQTCPPMHIALFPDEQQQLTIAGQTEPCSYKKSSSMSYFIFEWYIYLFFPSAFERVNLHVQLMLGMCIYFSSGEIWFFFGYRTNILVSLYSRLKWDETSTLNGPAYT